MVNAKVPPFGGHKDQRTVTGKCDVMARPSKFRCARPTGGAGGSAGKNRFLKHILLAACKSKSLSLETGAERRPKEEEERVL